MSRLIHLGLDPETLPEGAVALVAQKAPEYELLVTTSSERIRERLDDIEIAFGDFPHDLIASARSLRWLQQYGAGADWLRRYPEVQELDVVITSASGVHAIPISEHMIGFLLALGRGFQASVRGQVRRDWDATRGQQLFELAGKRVLLLGVGAIGERFARLCAAFDMDVVGVRRDPSRPAGGVSRTVGLDALDAELHGADVIANTLPLTNETHRLLGRRQFALMKRGVVVINVGRGGTIDEQAMIEALRDGTLRAAGLDVFEEEPLPKDSPLWGMDHVLITPHYSGLTPHYTERLFDIFVDNLERYLAGTALRNVVDKRLGY